MKRIIKMVLCNILLVPFIWIRLCYHAAHPDKYTEEEHFKLFRYIVKRANIGGNVEIEVHGQEKIPEKNGFMMTPNHQGLYDVLAMIDTCPKPFGMVYKKELAGIPLIKQVAICTKSFMMDREDIRQSMQIILDVTKELKGGRNYLIFPEGTRSKNGNQVGSFKGGSFKAATKAKCPIVPVAIIDGFKPFDSHTLEKTKVQVHYLDPLTYEDYKDLKTNEIAELVQNRIQETINANTVE